MSKSYIMSPSKIYDEMSKQVIGQERAKKAISNAVFMHYVKCYRHIACAEAYGPKSNVLIMGPSGCGKTHMLKSLEDIIPEIPILSVDAMSLTRSGYVGNSLESLIENWAVATKSELVNYGIVFIDEIDKLCYTAPTEKSEDYNRTIQQSILRIVEGTKIDIGTKQLDTSNLLFIFGGNFEELRKRIKKEDEKREIGFSPKAKKKDRTLDQLHNTLMSVGLIQELAGRISTITEVKPLSRKDLKAILMNPHGGPYQNYIDLFKILKEDLKLSEYHINKIVDSCCGTKIGARGLQTALDNHLQNKIFDIPDIDFS